MVNLFSAFPHALRSEVPSFRYVGRFNAVAEELKVPLRFETPSPGARDAAALLRIAAPEAQSRYGEAGLVPSLFRPELLSDVHQVVTEVENRRLDLVKRSFDFHLRVPYRAPLHLLTATERAAVEILVRRVKPAIDRIEARQQDPHASELAAWMVHSGDYFSRRLFERFRRDTGAGQPFFRNPELSLFPFFPDRPPINGMIDPTIGLEEFAALGSRLADDAEELRPTTLLVREAGGIRTIPLPLHPDFREDHLELAEALEEITALDVDGPLDSLLKDQLQKWARFSRSGTAADEAAAAQATVDAGESGGNLRVHLGPSESYWDDNTKFPYCLQVGIRDPELSARLAGEREIFPVMEALLAGIPHYEPRPLSTRGGFADPIYEVIRGGFIETFFGGEVLGDNYPNYAGYRVEGSNRFINLEAHQVAAAQARISLGRLLDEEISGWDAEKYFIQWTVDHESGHLLGPPRGHVTPDGRRMAVVFARHWGSGDEPKSDLTSSVKVRLLRERGMISEEEERNRLMAALAWHFSNRYRGKADFAAGGLANHPFGHMLEVGQYFKTGVLTVVSTDAGRRIHPTFEKMSSAAEELWRRVISFQAAGDLDGYLQYAAEMVSHIPDEADAMILEANRDVPRFFIERSV